MFKQLQRSALLLAAMLATLHAAAYDFEKDGIYYDILSEDEKTVSVTSSSGEGWDDDYSGDIIVPETVNYNNITYTVVRISNYAFGGCRGITSVKLPNTIEYIGKESFCACGLLQINLPNSLTSIGESAFQSCTKLTSIELPDSLKGIGDAAFAQCSTLVSIDVPNTVTRIGESAFSGCQSLLRAKIPESLSEISEHLFSGCKALKEVSIPITVKSIGLYAFAFCNSLERINIPDGVTNIGEYAFSDCFNLTSIKIPEGVTRIRRSTFSGCSSLTSIDIPDGVPYIDYNAFTGCSSLTNITIPESVTSIFPAAFHQCTNLSAIYCQSATPPSLVNSNVFDNYSATVYVPAGTKASYQSPGEWSKFSNIVEVVYAEISPIGYASFASKYAVDFSGQEGLTAYIGKYNEAENTLTLTEVSDAPAETGLILKGEAGKTYALAVTETATTTDKGDLKAVTEDAQVNSDMKNYVLSQVDGEVGFYRFTGTDIAAGHSYLELSDATNARAITLSFDNTTTGICSLNAAATTEAQPKACYNLSGQRVAKPTKGLYIIGGKKVVVK